MPIHESLDQLIKEFSDCLKIRLRIMVCGTGIIML